MPIVGVFSVLFFCVYQADITPSLAGISTAGAISISRPDMALLRASIYAPHLKGAFGESHMHTYIAMRRSVVISVMCESSRELHHASL
jgi:hypothetical protein